MKVRLWYKGETEKAYRYSKLPPERNPGEDDYVWVPKSVVEHRTKRGDEHEVTVADWFGEKEGL